MTQDPRRDFDLAGLAHRIFLIASALVAMAALVVAYERRRSPALPEAPLEEAFASGPALPFGPIAAEANVFRTNAGMLAIDPGAGPERPAHPRNLTTYRGLRAYPGAPPRIPHGFTGDEFRTGACNVCHERGGYSPRFGTYVPVTPHPEMGLCLQCHVGNDEVTGVQLPDRDPNTICRQCHAPRGTRYSESTLDWRPAAWPQTTPRAPDRSPPPILHDLPFRGNCVACHAGPSAVAEIRIDHPQRANCRQCHVTIDTAVEPFTLAPTGNLDRTGNLR